MTAAERITRNRRAHAVRAIRRINDPKRMNNFTEVDLDLAAQAAVLRAGIKEFREMLEARYVPDPRLSGLKAQWRQEAMWRLPPMQMVTDNE